MPFKQIHLWLPSQLHPKLLVCTGFLPPRSILVLYLLHTPSTVLQTYCHQIVRSVFLFRDLHTCRYIPFESTVLSFLFNQICKTQKQICLYCLWLILFSWFLELKAELIYFSCSLTHLGHTFSFSWELFFLILGFWHVALCHSLTQSLKGVSDLLFNPRDTMRGVLTFSGRRS